MSFAEHITANMLGGIGYFQGSSIVDASSFVDNWDNEDEFNPLTKRITPKLTSPVELFTATPSRSFFPRGFYWCVATKDGAVGAAADSTSVTRRCRDEGFHLLVIGEWDNDLSLEILQSWMSLLDEDGWIAREQILGEEARSRVRRLLPRTRHDNVANQHPVCRSPRSSRFSSQTTPTPQLSPWL